MTTFLLLTAEFFHFVMPIPLGYQLIMAAVGIIGIIPILLTAISSLQIKAISIDVLVTIAVIGAFIIGEFNEAAIVTWLFMLGEVLEEITLSKTRSAVNDLAKIAPQTALIINENNEVTEEDVDMVDPGDHILVRTGSQVPVDGKILTGRAILNEATITGESKLVTKTAGAKVFAGTLLENGTITVETTAAGEETTFGRIVELVEEAQDSQTKTQRFIDKFAQYYTPAILVIAILVGLISQNFRLAITVMVLGCPGALVIGVPASTVAGIGNGAQQGILFKGSDVMDRMRHVDTIAFDKTGTLTVGQPAVTTISVLQGDRQEIINAAVAIEKQSSHPLAKAIAKLKTTVAMTPHEIETVKGKGVCATIGNHRYLIGNFAMVQNINLHLPQLKATIEKLSRQGNSVVIIASDDGLQIAVMGIKDQLRPNAKAVLTQLKSLGISQLVMLTGDNEVTAKEIATDLPLTKVVAGMLPGDKAQFIKEQQEQGRKIAFVGDGINDSPALSQADVAIAMGSGTDVAMDVSDLVLVKSNLKSLVAGFKLARATMNNMKENIIISLLTVLLLFGGLFAGYIEMASGMLIHELSILLVILNAMRLITFSRKVDRHQFNSPEVPVE
nr:heavy metal translocating P-type ATPase [Limosilactobacillus rudii]